MKIYHNNRCSKSRQALQLLQEKEQNIEIVEYLKTPVDAKELKSILSKLNIPAFDLIRKGEAIYKEEFKGKTLTESEWIEVMINNPKLIERPIVVNGNSAVIGRPPEKVLELF